jgi:hypothetical protein
LGIRPGLGFGGFLLLGETKELETVLSFVLSEGNGIGAFNRLSIYS